MILHALVSLIWELNWTQTWYIPKQASRLMTLTLTSSVPSLRSRRVEPSLETLKKMKSYLRTVNLKMTKVKMTITKRCN